MLKEELKDRISDMAHYAHNVDHERTETTDDSELDAAFGDANLLGSLVDMLNAIPAQSSEMNDEFEDALEAIAYQKIKARL
jgi:hypothetical protein